MAIMTTPGGIASEVAAGLKGRKGDALGRTFSLLLLGSVLMVLAILAVLLREVISGGWSVLVNDLGDLLRLPLGASPETSGLSQALRGTFWIGVFTVTLAFPLGIGAAIYLQEFANSRARLAQVIDVTVRNLAGVPSVVYGILGLTIFVQALGDFTGPNANGRSVISAGLTLVIVVLPIIIITTTEALRAVPDSLREAGFGVGATRWEVVRHHVLPYAAPGALTGTVLALARALGEASPLILVGATTGFLTGGDSYSPGSLQDRFTALPIAITAWARRPEEHWGALTAAAIVVLLAVVLLANLTAILLRNHFEKKRS